MGVPLDAVDQSLTLLRPDHRAFNKRPFPLHRELMGSRARICLPWRKVCCK